MSGAVVTFTLQRAYPLLNKLLRMHFHDRKKLQLKLAWDMKFALAGKIPAQPFRRAKVRIERHSPGMPDHDGLVGGAKPLLDCLTTPRIVATNAVPKTVNALGLGIVVDDNPSCIITLEVVPVRCSYDAQKTVVRVEEVV